MSMAIPWVYLNFRGVSAMENCDPMDNGSSTPSFGPALVSLNLGGSFLEDCKGTRLVMVELFALKICNMRVAMELV